VLAVLKIAPSLHPAEAWALREDVAIDMIEIYSDIVERARRDADKPSSSSKSSSVAAADGTVRERFSGDQAWAQLTGFMKRTKGEEKQ
jgi:hypothetical protein